MSQRSTYRIWLKLVIQHEYFDAKQCGLTIQPNSITSQVLRKAGILFKQLNSCTWILVAEEDIHLDSDTTLCFQLKTQRDDFYYYTDRKTKKNDHYSFTNYNKGGIWKLLNVPVTEERLKANDPETLEIPLKSSLRHIEFLIFPSQSYTTDPLEIREQRGQVSFAEREELTLPGTEKTLYRFISSKTLPLKQKSDYQFHLWELKKSGENLLSRLPDFPLVQSISPFSPEDTITSYIYL